MTTYLIGLVVLGTTIWMAYDSHGNRVPNNKEPYSLNNGAVAWFVSGILLWIVIFPYYLFRRSQVLRGRQQPAASSAHKTHKHPVAPSIEKKKSSLVIIFVAVLVICGGGLYAFLMKTNNVSIVKNGMLDFDKTLTVGDAIDKYQYWVPGTVKWKSFTSDNGRDIVEASAEMDSDRGVFAALMKRQAPTVKTLTMFFQFVLHKSGGGFEVLSLGIDVVLKDGTTKRLDAAALNYNQLDVMKTLRQVYGNQQMQ